MKRQNRVEWNGKRSERYKSGVQETKMQAIKDREKENAKFLLMRDVCAHTIHAKKKTSKRN